VKKLQSEVDKFPLKLDAKEEKKEFVTLLDKFNKLRDAHHEPAEAPG